MKKNGFTIIELMITITIIIVMTVLAIPAFSRFEKNSEWVNKTTEISSLIQELKLKSENPSPGTERYSLVSPLNSNKIDLVKSDNFTNPERTVVLSNDFTLAFNYATLCPVGETSCCLTANNNSIPNSCDNVSIGVQPDQFYNNIELINGGRNAKFWLKVKPFVLKTEFND